MTAKSITLLCYSCMFFVIYKCVGGKGQQQLQNELSCIEKEECGACLVSGPHCRWCADPYFRNGEPRCNDDESLVQAGCSQGMIQRQRPAIWEVIENRTLQDVHSEDQENVVQIQPQKIRISLKPRESKKIKFSYRPAKNYPLDLYYLMDLTWSMKDDKMTLVSLGDDLLAMIKNLTDNYRIGYGSFADKPAMPYTYMDKNRKENPCTVADESCEATYSFKHHLSLTTEGKEFIEKLNSSSVTANVDNAEAQLEALVQVITCSEIMGWATHSRKIVILLSDGLMHTAGDGKIGGTVLRNDEQCHLDENGYYSESLTYDYPSVAQIYRLLKNYKVNVIFAVTNDVKRHYDKLHELLKGFTHVATLESDSSNILKLVKMGYEEIVSVVDFKDNSNIGPVTIKYFTDCGVPGAQFKEATRCEDVSYGMTLNYEAVFSLKSCSEFKTVNQTIYISESQLGQDSLSVDVEIQCGCDCESDRLEGMSNTCPINSRRVCGVCQCDQGWMGPQCNCNIKDFSPSLDLLAQCRENYTSGVCSGAGDCFCGKCDCDRGFNGRYCQCKTCEIDNENGLECGGLDRGTCMCGKCKCEEGWSGVACDCTQSNETCIAKGSDQICSGRGDCVCGQCECWTQDGYISLYKGAYCESCPSCPNPLCAHAEPCLSCYLNSSCIATCDIVRIDDMDNYNETEFQNSDAIHCVLRNDGCDYRYVYTKSNNESSSISIVIYNVQCGIVNTARFMNVGLAVMTCVVVIGIIMILVYKCGQIVSDKRAYAKFVKEVEASKFKENQLNPIYKSPISQFTLPEEYPRDHFE
ncbi:integrin beta-nu-like isoform X2 [Galleria mellonella]|uniref:Integrin beta n=1 Tax=Galleria mellonella TaxID=7137 RepID=A0ABM3N030_GALME|nr:integrin beta-nu-like isoform X2 [Galleria mellonella]